MGPPKMLGTARDRLEAGAGAERTSGDGGRHTHGCGRNCRDDNDNNRDIRIGKGNGGGGVPGGQWLQWGGMERGGRLRPTHFDDRRYTGKIT